MGGAVSSGRDNTELIDNLMGGNYIRTRDVERVFRALDRGDYMTPEARDQAYKDLAWRNGPLHMSAPCIYSEVMEGLELKPGLSFLNVGSGTGYLSTLVGLILGSSGINHGVEVHPVVVEYANKKLAQFMDVSPTLDEFDFCEPKFLCGNGLCLAPLQAPYDRVYCGAGCPEEYQSYFQQLIKVGGVLIMPLNDNLLQVKRTGPAEWVSRSLLNVSFATLRVPTKEEKGEVIRLEEQAPARLQLLTRSVIRECMRGAMHPNVREPPPRAPPAKRACPRRICIPVDDDSDTEGLNALHDLDRASGANEMNALLSLVLSMGHNRVPGALRVDALDSDSSSSSYHAEDDNDEDRMSPTLRIVNVNERPRSGDEADARPSVRSVLMFEFRDRNGVVRGADPPAARQRRARRHTRRPPRARGGDADRQLEDSDGSELADDDIGFMARDDGALNDGTDGRPERAADDDLADDDLVGFMPRYDDDSLGDRVDSLRQHFEHNGPGDADPASENNPDDVLNDSNVPLDRDTDREDVESTFEETDNAKKTTLENETELENKDTESKDRKVAEDKEATEKKDVTAAVNEPKSDEHEGAAALLLLAQEKGSTTQGQASTSRVPAKCKVRRGPNGTFIRHTNWSKDIDKKSKKNRRRSSKSTRRSSNDKKENNKNPEVPAEVEICLGKTAETAGPSAMEWETMDPIEEETNVEEKTAEVTKTKEEKRKKLDSGIGGENSPSGASGGAPGTGSEGSHNSGDDSHRSDTDSDEGCDEDGRRRRQKRGHLSTRSSSSTSCSDSEELVRDASGQYHARRPRRPRKDHDSARRAALSLLMQRAVKELPLPLALQRFVNLGRCFQF